MHTEDITQLKSGTPRHEQISEWLRVQIEQGTWKADEKLPSESQLEKQFGVSRITIRRSLQTLESEHLIYRRQGLGSFVQGERIQHGLVRLTDFAEDMSGAGLKASSRILSFGTDQVPATVAMCLGVAADQKLMRLDRLRLGNGEPIAYDQTWLPPFYAQLIRGRNLEHTSIFRILEEEYDIPVVAGRYRMEAVNASAEVAALLDVPAGQAIQLISRLTQTVGDRPLYFQKRFYRSDRVAYELVLSRESNATGHSERLRLKEFEPVFSDGNTEED